MPFTRREMERIAAACLRFYRYGKPGGLTLEQIAPGRSESSMTIRRVAKRWRERKRRRA